MPATPEQLAAQRDAAEYIFGYCQCFHCKHYYLGELACDAFDMIPFEIFDGKHNHKTPYPNDKGILFDSKDEAEGR